jgi:hypothetical protein
MKPQDNIKNKSLDELNHLRQMIDIYKKGFEDLFEIQRKAFYLHIASYDEQIKELDKMIKNKKPH